MQGKSNSGPMLIGLFIVVFGVLLLLGSLGMGDIGEPWRWLPSILIVLGLWSLVQSGFRVWTGPAILIVIGVAVQLTVLDVLPDRAYAAIWPAAVILMGLVLLFRGSFRFRPRSEAMAGDSVNMLGVFYGAEQIVRGPFRRGQITCVFGGAKLDLRHAHPAASPVVVDATCLFGGAEILIPATRDVRNEVMGLFGGSSHTPTSTAAPVESGPRIVVQGVAMFGGVDIRS